VRMSFGGGHGQKEQARRLNRRMVRLKILIITLTRGPWAYRRTVLFSETDG
jgi:hypothetical protein